MKTCRTLVILACLAVLFGIMSYTFPSAEPIGVANIVVTNIYWGSNPQLPETAHPGDVNVQLSIVLSNVGDDTARGVSTTLMLGPPLKYTYYIDGTEYSATSVSKVAGDMAAGSSFTLAFTVSIDSDAKEGIYRYELQVSYKSARELQQLNKSITIDVPIWWGDLRVQSVITVPTKIYPGSKQVIVKVAIANSGRGTASNLQLWLDLKPPFKASSSGSDRLFLGNLPPGQISEADFVVDVQDDAAFGQYSVVLAEERDAKRVPIGEIPLYINEKVKFEIDNVAPSEVNVGDTGIVIRVALRNAGSVKADSVRVQLRVGNFFSGTLTDFLGTMLAGEVKVAFFTVDIDAKAQARQYNFDLRIDWTQEENALDDTLTVSLNVVSPSLPAAPIAVVVMVAIAVAGYFMYRRRKMKTAQPTTK